MATIGSLLVDLGLSTARFETQLKKVDKSVNTVGKRMSRGFKQVDKSLNKLTSSANLFKGALLTLATGAVARFINSNLQMAQTIGATADKLGLSTTALQELRFAAEQANVPITTFDMAFQRFTRRAGEAAIGTGEAKAALAELGVQLTDSQGRMRTSEALFIDVADRMSMVSDATQQLRLGFKLFDSEGAALVNMLRNGSGAMEAMREKARQLGLVLSDDVIRGAEQASKELKTLNNALRIQATLLATEVSPAFITILDLLNKAIKGWRMFAESVGLADASMETLVNKRAKAMIEFQRRLAQGANENTLKMRFLREEIDRLDEAIKNANLEQLSKVGQAGAGPAAGAVIGDNTNLRDQIATRLQVIQESFFSEEQALIETNLKKQEIIDQAHELRILNDEAFLDMSADLELQHLEKMDALRSKFIDKDQAMWNSGWKGKLNIVNSALGAISGALLTGSKKQFEIGKKLAISSAIIDTSMGVAKTLGAYAFPLSAVMAAAQLALGIAQVNRIKSTSFGAGGGPTANLSPATPASALPPVEGQATPQFPTANIPRASTTFVLEARSGSIDPVWMNEVFIPAYDEARRDGAGDIRLEVIT